MSLILAMANIITAFGRDVFVAVMNLEDLMKNADAFNTNLDSLMTEMKSM